AGRRDGRRGGAALAERVVRPAPKSRAQPRPCSPGGRCVRMLIAGGGTGGHLFPGIALAEEVTTRHPDNRVLFVGTTRGLEARVVPAAGFPLETIQVRGLKGMGPIRSLQALALLPLTFLPSWPLP